MHWRHTIDAMLSIMVWSFVCMMQNFWPSARHDESPWEPTDKKRASFMGPLGFYGAMLQVRGDWSWYKQVFGFHPLNNV